MTTVIMLSGWAGSGKDAAASILMDELGFQRFAFADPLKHDVARETGIPINHFYEPSLKDKPYNMSITPRDHLIRHAAEARAKYPNIYANMIADTIQRSGSKRIVISDWRYRNEYDVIQTFFQQVIRVSITRPDVTQSSDPSEHDLDDQPMDIQINNGGSLNMLRSTLKDLLRPYLSREIHY
jgi:dephospho-CoA kinase